MSYRKRSILYSERFLEAIRPQPLTVVDVGARGSWIEPFGSLLRSDAAEDAVRTVAFEPDADAKEAPDAQSVVDRVPAAAWSDNGTVTLHVTDEPSASSVYQPDPAVLEEFRIEHETPRRPAKTVMVDSVTIDKALLALGADPDFLKLDTQGAEYEILQGASWALDRTTAVLAEAWTVPVHNGQRCLEEILALMRESGYFVADLWVGGRWQHRIRQPQRVDAKGDAVVVHVLFLSERQRILDRSSELKLVKAAALADVWGHADFSLQLLENAPDSALTRWATTEILRLRARRRRGATVRDTLAEALSRILGVELRSYPPLG